MGVWRAKKDFLKVIFFSLGLSLVLPRDRAKHCFCSVFVLLFELLLLVWVVLVVVLVLLGVVFLAPVAVVACHHFYLF